MLKPQFNDVTCNDHLLLVSFNVIPQLSRINLDPVLEIRGAPRPGLWGHHLWFKREEKNLQKCGFSRDFTGEMFDFQRCLGFFLFFASKLMAEIPKKWKKRSFDDFRRTTSGG